MSETSNALGMQIPEPHVDTWNASMERVTDALEKIDAFAGDMATIERSPSVGDHAVGEFLLWAGRLYRVIDEITEGDVLSVNVNVEHVDIGTNLERALETNDHFWADSDGAHISSDSGSLSVGDGTLASSENQTTIGKFNIEDTDGTYAIIIGNGTASDARSNVLTVGWNGNTTINGKNGAYTHLDIISPLMKRGENPAQATWAGLQFCGSDGRRISYLEAHKNSSGVHQLNLVLLNDSDTEVYGGFRLSKPHGTTGSYWLDFRADNGELTVNSLITHGPAEINNYLAIDNAGIDRDGTLPASDYWGPGLFLRDANDEPIGQVRPILRTDGRIDMRIVAVNEKNGSDVINELQIRVDRNGNQTYSVSNPYNFRAAIGENGSVTATLNSTYTSGGNIECIRKGDVVFYNINGLVLKQYTGRQQVATIPAGYRPQQVIYANFNAASSIQGYIIIQGSGAVQVDGGSARTVWGSACGIRA